MANQTIKAQGNTFSGSIGAGMGSLFNPSGRKYYILEHKVSSKYHKQGESQEIIVDTVELGRDSRCQVRFDERFNTVSRRHAAIVKDGDGWKLVQLSKTNSTDAREAAGRVAAPLKITSCIFSPRNCLADDSPKTQRTASITLLLPQPLGPTTPTSRPGTRIVVASAKDLKPDKRICVSFIAFDEKRKGGYFNGFYGYFQAA